MGDKTYISVPLEFFEEDLTGLEIKVLGTLLRYADRKGRCWPSQDLQAKRLGSDRGRISKTIGSLTKKGCIRKTARGEGKGYVYQIAERFLVAPSSRRPADTAVSAAQRTLLLPIDGKSRDPCRNDTGSPPTDPCRNDTTPSQTDSRRRSKKDWNPSSSTESGTARAREAAEIIRRTAKNSGLSGAARRSGPNLADPAVRRAQWMSNCIEHMALTWSPPEYRRALEVIVGDAESPAAKRLLERASSERGALAKRRGRPCRSPAKVKRAPVRPATSRARG